MATYDQLTPEQKGALAEWDLLARGGAGALHRFLSRADIASPSFPAIEVLLASLDANEVIPKNTDLPAAQPLTKEQHEALMATTKSLLSGFYTDALRGLAILAVGANNLLSEG